MKRLPRQAIHRIYNPIDNREVNSAEYNPEMLDKGIDTYTLYEQLSALSATDLNGLCDYGVEYNNFRLSSFGHLIPSTGIGNDQYVNSELYRLQNPEFSADYEKHHSIYPSMDRYLLIQRILQNYLTYPTYNVGLFSGLNGDYMSSAESAFNPETDFFATIPESDWLMFAEIAHSAFYDSLALGEGTSALNGKYDWDSYQKKLVVDEIRSNSGDSVDTHIEIENNKPVVYSETLEEFEAEYQAFIEMLRKQKEKEL